MPCASAEASGREASGGNGPSWAGLRLASIRAGRQDAAQQASPGAAREELVALGETVYRAGIREKGVAACAGCHSPTGLGNGPAGFPALSGQHADYIAVSLRAFRNDERTNDGDTRIMRDVASRLSDKEIDAVASYASGLH